MVDHSSMKLGKNAVKFDHRTMKLAKYLPPLMPLAEAQIDYSNGVTDWGVMMNAELGNCVVHDTNVSAKGLQAGYKSRYNGPVVVLTLKSGKQLTVTPNHAVLTPRGFVLAHCIKQGDDLIGARGAQILPQLDINEFPSTIQEVISALDLCGGSVREIMPTAVDFHGDGQFFDGNINVVRSERFLRSKLDTLLSEPNRQKQVGATGKLEGYFQSSSPAFLRRNRGFAPPLGNVGFGGNRTAFSGAHVRVSQTNGLQHGTRSVASRPHGYFEPSARNAKISGDLLHRLAANIAFYRFAEVASASSKSQSSAFADGAELKASIAHPSNDGAATDFSFTRDLLNRHAGSIEVDRVVNVNCQNFTGHVYDLSTDSRWYIANGIITHNCTCAAACHLIQLATMNDVDKSEGQMQTLPDSVVLDLYERWCGYDPNNPDATDNGGVELFVLNRWRQEGIQGHRLLSYAAIDLHNYRHLQYAINKFNVYIGVELPVSAQNQETWDVVADDGGKWGGHAVCLTGYDDTKYEPIIEFVSWGKHMAMTLRFWNKYVSEAYALMLEDWEGSKSHGPEGFDVVAWQSDLKQITAA